jgi:predicted ABC-type transport system involved in lysophospholipase L1 biosynthesis ATPase subunit
MSRSCSLQAASTSWQAARSETLWREHGLTLVLVTHDSAIAGCAERVATMNDGYLSVALAPEDR